MKYISIIFCLFISINVFAQNNNIQKKIAESLISKFQEAHQNEEKFVSLKEGYLVDENMFVFDDIREFKSISLRDYLSFFWGKKTVPNYNLNTLHFDSIKTNDRQKIYEINITRTYHQRSKVIYFFIEEVNGNYKIKEILLGGKKETNIKNLPYVSSISGYYQHMKISDLYATNIGATTPIDKINCNLFGLTVSFAISNVRFIEGLKFNISGSGGDVGIDKSWSKIDENALYAAAPTKVNIKNLKVINIEFNTQLYVIQTLSGWRGKNYWQKTKRFRFDLYGILGVKRHFYEFEIDTKNVANMNIENTIFNSGLGAEFWFLKTSEASAFIEFSFENSIENQNVKLYSESVKFFNIGLKINFNPLNK